MVEVGGAKLNLSLLKLDFKVNVNNNAGTLFLFFFLPCDGKVKPNEKTEMKCLIANANY